MINESKIPGFIAHKPPEVKWSHNIQIDSLFDVIRNNGEILKEAIDDIKEDEQ